MRAAYRSTFIRRRRNVARLILWAPVTLLGIVLCTVSLITY